MTKEMRLRLAIFSMILAWI